MNVTVPELIGQGQAVIGQELLDSAKEAGIAISKIHWQAAGENSYQLVVRSEDGQIAEQEFSGELILSFFQNGNSSHSHVMAKIVSIEIQLIK